MTKLPTRKLKVIIANMQIYASVYSKTYVFLCLCYIYYYVFLYPDGPVLNSNGDSFSLSQCYVVFKNIVLNMNYNWTSNQLIIKNPYNNTYNYH